VLKEWPAWPRSIRWLAWGIAVAVLALVVAWALFVPMADWLAHHDTGSATGLLHETALDNARGRLLTLGAGLLATGALVFTARAFWLSREGQVTDRYIKAIEQLGSDKLDVRIGGIYALERIARDSAGDHPVVMGVLTAFIREHSHDPWPPPGHPAGRATDPSPRPDIQAAVAVVLRREVKRDIGQIDLAGADLRGAFLAGADFRRANLRGAFLDCANLSRADLADAALDGVDLFSADLALANLASAGLGSAGLRNASFVGADLTNADLAFAEDLSEATFTAANLAGVRWPEGEPVPEGWKLNAGTGRLQVG
jgi:Pentapeptide repeats (8 copies)